MSAVMLTNLSHRIMMLIPKFARVDDLSMCIGLGKVAQV